MPQTEGKRPISEAVKDRQIPLLWYLSELGEAYSCFFTVEEAWKEGEVTNALESHYLKKPLGKGDLQQALGELRRTVPNLTYEINKRGSDIVHVMDMRLLQQRGYGLESIIRSIEFKGTMA